MSSYRKLACSADDMMRKIEQTPPCDLGLRADSVDIDIYGTKTVTLTNEYGCWQTDYSKLSSQPRRVPHIERLIFNPPATIIMWSSGEKTIVKCREGETFDPEKGLAMAIAKRALGRDYKKEFKGVKLMEELDAD